MCAIFTGFYGTIRIDIYEFYFDITAIDSYDIVKKVSNECPKQY